MSVWLTGLGVAVSANQQTNDLVFIGEARDIGGGGLLYTETHRVERDEAGEYLYSRVRYAYPDGTLIAEKTLDFAPSLLMPALQFEDVRTGHQIQTRWVDHGSEPSVRLIEQAAGEKRIDSLSVFSDQPSVIDAGFDRLVEKNWSRLIQGDRIAFDFLALTRGKFVGLVMFVRESDSDSVRIRIEVDNWFFRMLVDPIELEYSRESRRLQSFTGLTNIERVEAGEPSGENYRARIEYRYEGQVTP